MKKNIFFTLFLIFASAPAFCQQVDSIYFHLYTDSLKKGQHNYINVDGKLANGKWLPLTEKEVSFSCGEAVFTGNELIIPENFSLTHVTITATLKRNTAIKIQRTIWIKQIPDPPLPGAEDRSDKPYRKNRRN